MKRKLKGRGGPGRGQGRPHGSTKPEMRIGIAQSYVTVIEQIREQAEGEGRRCNPVTDAYLAAYAEDHSDKVTLRGGGVSIRAVIKINDEQHFRRYCETQKKLRRRGKREAIAELNEELAQEALERARRERRNGYYVVEHITPKGNVRRLLHRLRDAH